MAITTAITNFVMSLHELFVSVLGAAYSLGHSIFMAIFGFIGGLLTLAGDVAEELIDIAGGISKFVLGRSGVLGFRTMTRADRNRQCCCFGRSSWGVCLFAIYRSGPAADCRQKDKLRALCGWQLGRAIK